jgi:hypothetical protein
MGYPGSADNDLMELPRWRPGPHLRVDPEGELMDTPSWLPVAWVVLLALVALEAVDELHSIVGPPELYRLAIHDSVLVAATVLIFARAAAEPIARRAWLSFGFAMALWTVGTIAWSLVYGSQVNPPYPSFADVLWLLWYPFMVLGMVFLIRVGFEKFEVHRWMDGIAVMLLVLVAGFGLVVQPVAERSTHSWVATVVDFGYPVLDVLLIGALLGVYGLLGWRPDAMWVFLGCGIAACTAADAAFAVEQARGVVESGHYDFVWTLGALSIAYAAWVRSPIARRDDRRVTGMRAVALALVAQALAIAIQITAIFKDIGKSERVVTVLVLAVASVQIVLARPRGHSDGNATSTGDSYGPK